MKLLHQCMAFGLLAVLATSCSQDAPWSGGSGAEGKISLKLNTDLSVKTSTRANDSESPVKPDGERFAIRLENVDGSYVKEWENLNKFNAEEGFPRGNYTVTAYYGDENSQGFLNPYYVGTQNITVKAGETTEHSVTAALANSMVSIRYTDSFLNYFNEYEAYITASGSTDAILVPQDESRPCYVKPGSVSVNFKITTAEGQTATVSPATFTADPRRHYIVTANVKETEVSGVMALEVQFDDNVDAETVDIILSDELYTTPLPEIQAAGFSFGDTIETFESGTLSVKPEFHVIAQSGIKQALFKVQTSNGTRPAIGPEIDLTSTDAIDRQKIELSKLNCYGFSRQPSGDAKNQMGVVELKEFIENLEPGDYTFSLTVTDLDGRTTESDIPCTLTASVKQVKIKIEPDNVPTKFMSEEVAVMISTNYEGAKDKFSFYAEDKDGYAYTSASVKSVTQSEATGSEYPYCYHYVLNVDKINDTDCRVEALYPKKSGLVTIVPVEMPEYKIEVDAFATKALIKVTPSDPKDLEMVDSQYMHFYNGGNTVDVSKISRDLVNGIITISGLEPAKTYDSLIVSLGSKNPGETGFHGTTLNFTTEATEDVPNGDFSAANQHLSISGLQVGGQYRVSPADYTLKSSIDLALPDGWATINAFTCWEGSSNKNTWFLVPSTYESKSKAVLRNVGYNHNGTTPARSGGAFNTTYYCENAPSENQLNRAAGELFLGSYSFDGSSHRVDGKAFGSRPSYLEFDYIYTPQGNDNGDVEIKVLDASGNVLAEGKSNLTTTSQTERHQKISLDGYPFKVKAATIQIRFRSSSAATPPITIPSGSALNEHQTLGNHTLDANTYHALATGSVLEIDNVHLGYE